MVHGTGGRRLDEGGPGFDRKDPRLEGAGLRVLDGAAAISFLRDCSTRIE